MIGDSMMTVLNTQRSRLARCPLSMRTSLFGVAVGILVALSAAPVLPAMAQAAPMGSADPAKRLPGAISVSDIDFNRGEGGSGKLTIRFSGQGALADMHNEADKVVIDVPNAALPATLQRPLNVADFATPVERIIARSSGTGTRLVLDTSGPYESLAYQSGNEYIVEIVPRAVPKTSVASGNVATTVSDPAKRTYSGRPVTFNFQSVPVRTVLQLIAEETDANLVASDSVTGNVTLRLINVPWDQALDIVLRANGLDKRQNGNVIWVAPQAEIAKYEQDIADARIAIENRVETVTEYIPINYANAENIAGLLTEGSKGGGGGAGNEQANGFLSSRGSISFDTRTNTLLVVDTPDKVSEIKRLVALLDKPVDQVLIEARIVIATESFARELGAKFGINGATGDFNDQSSLGFGSSVSQSSANAQARADAIAGGDPDGHGGISQGLNINLPTSFANAGSLALSILNAGYMLDVELSALQQDGRGEVISNPRIVTSNQREAVISQGTKYGYVTVSPSQGGGGIPIPNVQFEEIKLELKVTPTITSDGRVFMALDVQKDEIEGVVDTSIGDVPLISTRHVTTAVLVEDGQTVVIGGVYEFRDREDISKVPFLGDLPIIGNLFKSKAHSTEKAELLIFVTPKVMRVAPRGG